MSLSQARRKVLQALLAGLLLTPAACGKSDAPAQPRRPAAARPAAPGFTLKTADGKTVSLSQLKGKPVFLEFWATWCGPCRQSMPAVERLHKDYAGRLQVLGVTVDEDPSVVPAFLKAMGVTYTTLYAGSSGVDGDYRVTGIPAFFLIDAQGRVADAWIGFDPGFEGAWRRAVDELK